MQVGKDVFPTFQKACVTLPWGVHIGVGCGVKIEIVQPIERAVARLKVDAEHPAPMLGIPADVDLGILIASIAAGANVVGGAAFFIYKYRKIKL